MSGVRCRRWYKRRCQLDGARVSTGIGRSLELISQTPQPTEIDRQSCYRKERRQKDSNEYYNCTLTAMWLMHS
jgi:hypothetical protein